MAMAGGRGKAAWLFGVGIAASLLAATTTAWHLKRLLEAGKADARRLQLAASVFNAAAEGIVLADADQRIIDVNPAFIAMSGYARSELLGQRTSILRSGRQDRAYYQGMWQTIAEQGYWQGQLWDRRRDGVLFAAHVTITEVRDCDGRVSHYIALFADITDERLRQEEIERVAHADPLTGLPNRRLLADRLEQGLARAARSGCTVAVGAIDLDGFKEVNDSLGHAAGDAVLVEVAARLQRVVRANDTVARLGGDEFLLLLPDLDPAQPGIAEDIVRRALLSVREPIAVCGGANALVSASIGLALYPDDGHDAAALLCAGDAAMYESKRRGRDQYCRARAA
ncbi:sensor domain-containing diguanylate cyclase [Pseudoduganella sp. LjRoot289]|uniref:diguanylate cyclase domain-containing protein n=1 Tax=Pseudoduganella sp. LjRoot289 TaxID=3342314 RepID=UPI003ECC24B9